MKSNKVSFTLIPDRPTSKKKRTNRNNFCLFINSKFDQNMHWYGARKLLCFLNSSLCLFVIDHGKCETTSGSGKIVLHQSKKH